MAPITTHLPVDASGEVDCPTCGISATAKIDHYGILKWTGCLHAITPGSNGSCLTICFVEDAA